ncbi:hypothetical protein PENSPDRAFT_445326 [Peniophora sp. CONT]|nr:hypothetical protein PENSPDRAFT_445326 [Peniophora sp. CONT]
MASSTVASNTRIEARRNTMCRPRLDLLRICRTLWISSGLLGPPMMNVCIRTRTLMSVDKAPRTKIVVDYRRTSRLGLVACNLLPDWRPARSQSRRPVPSLRCFVPQTYDMVGDLCNRRKALYSHWHGPYEYRSATTVSAHSRITRVRLLEQDAWHYLQLDTHASYLSGRAVKTHRILVLKVVNQVVLPIWMLDWPQIEAGSVRFCVTCCRVACNVGKVGDRICSYSVIFVLHGKKRPYLAFLNVLIGLELEWSLQLVSRTAHPYT